jgi:hypothetical protein
MNFLKRRRRAFIVNGEMLFDAASCVRADGKGHQQSRLHFGLCSSRSTCSSSIRPLGTLSSRARASKNARIQGKPQAILKEIDENAVDFFARWAMTT